MNLTNEALIDAWVDRIVDNHKGSDTSLKKACLGASLVVGSYNGVTGVIAKRSRRSVSTVENWAHAARLYKDVRQVNRKLARCLFRALPASHWWLAYDIQQAGYEALHYLEKAHQHGWSGRAMLGEWNKDREAGTAPLILRRAKLTFRGLANELLKHIRQLTEAEHIAALGVLDAFEEQ